MANEALLYTVVVIFIVVGTALPFINDSFNVDSATFNTDGIQTEVGDENDGSVVFQVTRVVLSIFTIFFWSFEVSFGVNIIIFFPLRILLGFLIYQAIRGN